MEAFPLTVPVTLWRRKGSTLDGYGNETPRFEAENILVFAVSKRGSGQATGQRPEAAQWDATIYAPASAGITDQDRIEYDGETYLLDGPPSNFEGNPWWSPGLVTCRCMVWKG